MNKIVGKKLKESRISQSLSIEEISEKTFIRKHFLIALEEGNFSSLPSAAQVRGYLRSYADYLGLDSDEILDSLKQKPEPPSPIRLDENVETQEKTNILDKTKKMEEIFREIGGGIKKRRELLGLTLEEIEIHTHIQINYLQMVESGSFSSFPSPTQARGMLGNYANFLDMDKHAVMLRFADALQATLDVEIKSEKFEEIAKPSSEKRKITLPLWLRNILSADTFVFGILGIATIIFSIWGIGRVIDIQANTVIPPTAPALSKLLLPSETPEIIPTSSEPVVGNIAPINTVAPEDDETIDPTLQPFQGENIELNVIVRERTFLRVTVDGKIEFDGRVIPGSNLPYTANQKIELLTGNGAALQIFFNGTDLGPLGIPGEVVNVVYSRQGILHDKR